MWRTLHALAVVALAATPLIAGPPQRVVSMNLCTDQLALMLAAPGQLVSVSYLAHQPNASPMAREAQALPANHGLAEEIFLLRPDLVLAGRYTTVATVTMLERLGIPVARFEPENALDDVVVNLRRMGDVLHREAEAEARIAAFTADRARLEAHVADRAVQPRAALYYARGFTGGGLSLAGDILRAAGLINIAEELGYAYGGYLALESLIMSAPDRLLLGRRQPGYSQAQALLDHPALRAMPAHARGVTLTDRDWVCGTPLVLEAVARLIEAGENS